MVSIKEIIGANKKYGAYWVRIKAEFDERKYLDKKYVTMPMKRIQKAMSTCWAIIQAQVNASHGYHADLEARRDSGTSLIDLVIAPALLTSIFMRLYMLVFNAFFD
jgi:hypothetical protein